MHSRCPLFHFAAMIAVVLGVSLFCPLRVSAQTDEDAATKVRLKTSMGDVVLQLDRAKAPITVENFLKYVETGFYDDTVFHRIVKDFMIQGGGRTADLEEKKTGRPIRNEASNGLSNLKYTVAMARKDGDAHSATVQFFINLSDENVFLDRANARDGVGYTVFGKVVDGKDVVDEISKVATKSSRDPKFKMLEMDDVPVEPITILSATVVEPAKEDSAKAAESDSEPVDDEEGPKDVVEVVEEKTAEGE